MSELPYMQFYASDWLADCQKLSLEGRGAWQTILCEGWHHSRRGVVSYEIGYYAQLFSCTKRRAKKVLTEIEKFGIADVDWGENGVITVTCRRIVRDWEEAMERKNIFVESGKRGAEKRWRRETEIFEKKNVDGEKVSQQVETNFDENLNTNAIKKIHKVDENEGGGEGCFQSKQEKSGDSLPNGVAIAPLMANPIAYPNSPLCRGPYGGPMAIQKPEAIYSRRESAGAGTSAREISGTESSADGVQGLAFGTIDIAEQNGQQCANFDSQGASRQIPQWEEVKLFAGFIGLSEWKAEDWFREMEGCGWIDYRHRRIVYWKPVLQRVFVKWRADGMPEGPPTAKRSPGASSDISENQHDPKKNSFLERCLEVAKKNASCDNSVRPKENQ